MSKRSLLFALLSVMVALVFIAGPNAQSATSINTVQCAITKSNISPGACIAAAFPLGLIGIALSLMLVGLVYMIGEILNYDKLKGFYRNELWETLKSALILGIIFSSLVIASAFATAIAGIPTQFSGTPGSKIISNFGGLYSTLDTAYLEPQFGSAEIAFGGLIGLSVGNDLLRSVVLSAWFPIPLEELLGFPGMVAFGEQANLFYSNYITSIYGSPSAGSLLSSSPSIPLATAATDMVIAVLFLFQVQHDLLYVIAGVGLGVLIPMGLVMRAIPFLRNLGGTLIALGIGISVIYPMVLVGFNLPITDYMFTLSNAGIGTTSCPSGLQGVFCKLWNSILAVVSSLPGIETGTYPLLISFGANPNNIAVSSVASIAAGQGFWVGLGGPFVNGIFPELNFVIDNTFNQMVQALLFVMDIIITYAATDGIARLMGGKITLGVGRFKIA